MEGQAGNVELQSTRSKRSLSINVNKVSKIVKLSNDGRSAISKGSRPFQNNQKKEVLMELSRALNDARH